MAEIKSSIELAMEKTKHLIMSDEEKREQEKKELENRIRGILRKFKDKYIDREQVIKEFRNLREEIQKRVFVKVALDDLNLTEENEHVISVLELIDEKIKTKVETELEGMKKAFREELEKREMIVRERIREKLKEIGLHGDAMVVNISSWEEWEEAVNEVQAIFGQRMEKLKNSVLSDLPFQSP